MNSMKSKSELTGGDSRCVTLSPEIISGVRNSFLYEIRQYLDPRQQSNFKDNGYISMNNSIN